MKLIDTSIDDVKILEPNVYGDQRGFFIESYNQRVFNELTGREVKFVQDNHSMSQRGVLRGLHYQVKQAQGKLVRVTRGEVYDVVVDLRQSSPHFGQWMGVYLSAENFRQLWIPVGFAHGFLILVDGTEFLYKTTDFYEPRFERSIKWNDPELAIDWPIGDVDLKLSDKDENGGLFAEAEYFP